MNLSEPFIRKPVATTLLTAAVALAGGVAYNLLPVSPLPQIDFPTISVNAGLPGASPEIVASSIATPLERQFGRIAGVTEMTSSSTLGSTSITLQFDLNRNIDAAARDVEAAINAARGNLPANLPSNPTYRKVNPADSPIMIIALTSDVETRGQMYDAASTVLAQKLSQVDGVGQVTVGGSSLPAVRVEVNPTALNKYGIGLEDVRNALAGANSNEPKGHFSNNTRNWTIDDNDQLFKAIDYRPLIIAYRNSAPVRVGDVAQTVDSVEDLRNAGYAEGKPSVLLIINRQPGANIIQTVDHIKELIPQFQAEIPQSIHLSTLMDRTTTIRASIIDVERTLLISIGLVILVVFIFLRNVRTMIIPGIVVPVSLLGTFGVMYLLGFSLDNLSLMALTISTGFVVDDAIVVVENITRYIEKGFSPLEAALQGSKEIGFTVLSISLSLIAVFIPILMMGGIVGRLFREFAVTLSVAILVSMLISLTTTPMMCAILLRPKSREPEKRGKAYEISERAFERVSGFYEATLARILLHPALTLLVLVLAIGLNVVLFISVPKGFFPQQDTGRLMGSVQADQSTSFQTMQQRLEQMIKIVQADPAVQSLAGFTGGGNANTARFFIMLKPLNERISADLVMARLRPKLSQVPGATLYLQSAQDLRIGGRQSNALYQYTLQSDQFADVAQWAPKLLDEMRKIPILTDVNSDQQNLGLQTYLQYDRDTAARFGITSELLDNTLYDAFGQRQVSTMYTALNQYHVVMEANSSYLQSPESLRDIYVTSTSGQQVPLSALTHFAPTTAPLAVNHQGPFSAVTLSFNLKPGTALGDAVSAIDQAKQKISFPETVRGSFQGTAQAYQAALANEPYLIAAALAAVYIVLGILYESYIHPITILSTLPSAGVGAVLALLLTGTDLSLIAVIGVILLIGIVKKNAIMMIDFALAAERDEGKKPRDAIYEACRLRFRPIMMTTTAALFGALPLAFDFGTGAELRRPLGIAIIGGLLVSQMLTLYTTPVVYLYWERLALWVKSFRSGRASEPVGAPSPA
ncbi:MAG: multidrug efflux RND transporter permease subunit [Methylacidiphilales bacterium]|nr:multidrug efflux RND transporter permease subunit [Candidatus Methylacidiphilales bacterium]